jgi:hypothetical protein
VPATCASLNLQVGPAPDGCGGIIQCGTCPCAYAPGCYNAVTNPPDAWMRWDCCLGPGTCTPLTCAEQGITSGPAGDGCGNVLNCDPDPCAACGGGCPPCKPRTCAALGYNCGTWDDWCGGTLDCGTCDDCISCNNGVCGGTLVSLCVPTTCADAGVACGPAPDGCSGFLDCGSCPAPLTCVQGTCLPACM